MIEIIPPEEQSEKRMTGTEPERMYPTLKCTNIHIMRAPGEEKEQEKYAQK